MPFLLQILDSKNLFQINFNVTLSLAAMAQSESTESKPASTKWTQIASMNVMDGRQYESNPSFIKPAEYRKNPIGQYIGIDCRFVTVPNETQFPTLIPNVDSLIHEDLNKGYREMEHLIAETNQFMNAVTKLDFDISDAGIEFVTFRNNLNKIMAAPYFHSRSEYDAFAIDIVKKKNVIFLEIVDRSEILSEDNEKKEKQREFGDKGDGLNPEWWGRRFEELIRVFPKIKTMEKTEEVKEVDKENDDGKPSDKALDGMIGIDEENGNYELITLVQSELNRRHKILMAAEIDCIDDQGQYVEVKTTKYIKPKGNQYRSFGGNHRGNRNQSNYYRNDRDRGYSSNSNRNAYSGTHHQSWRNQNQAKHHPYSQQRQYHQSGTHSGHREQGHSNSNVMPIIPWYKSMKIWIQSYLAGVDNVVMGFRDEKGVVVDIKKIDLNYFGGKIHYFDKRKRTKIFKGDVCLNFTDRVLSFIKQNCTDEGCGYRVVFDKPWDKLILFSA